MPQSLLGRARKCKSTRQEAPMDVEDFLTRRPESPLAQLMREDLDRLSVDELAERISLLEGEIVRTKAKRDSATAFRSAADALFRK
jgi:uncharacterized small protein (DUF1192 family)